jgi:hypothetical protein
MTLPAITIDRLIAPPDWTDECWQPSLLRTYTDPPRYTTRPEWSSAGESMWMRLSKFSLLNRLSLYSLARLIAAQPESAFSGACRKGIRL